MDKAQEERITAKLQKMEHLLHQIMGKLIANQEMSAKEFAELLENYKKVTAKDNV